MKSLLLALLILGATQAKTTPENASTPPSESNGVRSSSFWMSPEGYKPSLVCDVVLGDGPIVVNNCLIGTGYTLDDGVNALLKQQYEDKKTLQQQLEIQQELTAIYKTEAQDVIASECRLLGLLKQKPKKTCEENDAAIADRKAGR
jgi:hypothetical protein